jgi:hypothetical protein
MTVGEELSQAKNHAVVGTAPPRILELYLERKSNRQSSNVMEV